MELWVVGKYIEIVYTRNIEGIVWEFGGIFSDKQKAINACTNKDMFIGPAILDYAVASVSEVWKGCWYPLLEDEPND